MDYFFTEEQQMMREVAREIAEKRIRPVAAEYDESGEFPWPIVEAIAEADLFRVFIPEEYEGMDLGTPVTNMCIVTEELSKACGGIALAFAATGLGTMPLLVAASDEQKKRWLPRIAAGTLAAFALTEANAGSDAGSVQTRAVLDGDHWVINGTKQWITNGGEADIYTVMAMTDKTRGPRGASCLIVEKGYPGFSFGKKEKKLGIHASATRELIFEDCEVPRANLVGREGAGFILAMKTFDVSRPGIAAQGVGLAQGALDEVVTYARQRIQFGRPIIANQGYQWTLADMATEIEASRALVYAVCRTLDKRLKDVSKISAMAKLFATDVAMRVATDAVQLLGGYGYTTDYPVEKMMRDAKILQIYEGTNQIQRDIIGAALIKEYASHRK